MCHQVLQPTFPFPKQLPKQLMDDHMIMPIKNKLNVAIIKIKKL